MSGVVGDEQLLGGRESAPKKTSGSLSVGIALLVAFGFGVAMTYEGGATFDQQCDQKLHVFLLCLGISTIVVSLVYLVLTLTTSGPSPLVICAYLCNLFFIASAIMGLVMYFSTKDCSMLEPSLMRWSWAAVLAILSLFSLLVFAIGGRITGPALSIIGNAVANIMAWFAGLFNGVSDVLNDEVKEKDKPENRPLPRDPNEEFVLVITHASFMWLFCYMVAEVIREWHNNCDRALHTTVMTLGLYGAMLAYADFLFEKFAAQHTRLGLKPYMPYMWMVNIAAWYIWGLVHSIQTFGSSTCKATSRDVYKLSVVLTGLYLMSCGLVVLLVMFIGFDYLWSGRVRFVVVFEASFSRPEDDNRT
eukprot:c3772_g1_i1.p1 GENE.c3772_g1_i1~~c3772_g1_i1.p1  ORF type:complete len:361 (-),score=98.59 c3772_g1_i1:277-1359(-)